VPPLDRRFSPRSGREIEIGQLDGFLELERDIAFEKHMSGMRLDMLCSLAQEGDDLALVFGTVNGRRGHS
jgi:hypothetical protein